MIGISAVPLSDEERQAVRLYYDKGHNLRTISALTGLSVKAIRAATDRVAAGWTDQINAAAGRGNRPHTDAADPTGPTAPRRRLARLPQPPGAHTPPAPRLPERELVAPTDARPATATATTTPNPDPGEAAPAAADGPGSPAWEALATSPTVRAWAIADGWHIPADTARLPGAIVLAYRNAHPETTRTDAA